MILDLPKLFRRSSLVSTLCNFSSVRSLTESTAVSPADEGVAVSARKGVDNPDVVRVP